MAADFPKPKYVGIDVAPIFPKSTFPNNIKFFQMDFLEGLPFDDGTFDFVYVRSLGYEFTESQWETFVYQELARLLKPGGWLEVQDYDMELTDPGPTLNQVNLASKN
jgi:SAM-dependent methyltransferase